MRPKTSPGLEEVDSVQPPDRNGQRQDCPQRPPRIHFPRIDVGVASPRVCRPLREPFAWPTVRQRQVQEAAGAPDPAARRCSEGGEGRCAINGIRPGLSVSCFFVLTMSGCPDRRWAPRIRLEAGFFFFVTDAASGTRDSVEPARRNRTRISSGRPTATRFGPLRHGPSRAPGICLPRSRLARKPGGAFAVAEQTPIGSAVEPSGAQAAAPAPYVGASSRGQRAHRTGRLMGEGCARGPGWGRDGPGPQARGA